MKIFTRIMAVMLAVLLAAGGAANIYAANKNTMYISDISVGYGDTGKEALTANGYKIWENLNANDGGRGDAVYIGYKETDDATQAITDISLMNMNGGYSFKGWADEVKQIEAEAQAMLEDFTDSLDEFKENYENGSPYAERVIGLLEYYYDDYSEKTIAEIILSDDEADRSALKNVFMMGNTGIVTNIELALAIGCTEWNDADNTFVDRLLAYKTKDKLDVSKNRERGIINEALIDLGNDITDAQNVIDNVKNGYNHNAGGLYEDYEDYLSKLPEDTLTEYLQADALITNCSKIKYANTKYTLKSIALKSIEKEGLTDELLEPLAQCMTPGQIGVAEAAGLGILVNLEGSIGTDEILEFIDEIIDESEIPEDSQVTVYYGVDTSIFEDVDTVALTSAVLRDKAASEGKTLGVEKEENLNAEVHKIAGIITSVLGGITVVAAIAWIIQSRIYNGAINAVLTIGRFGNEMLNVSEEVAVVTSAGKTLSIIGTVVIVALIITIIAIVVTILLKLFVKNEEPEDITYTQVPRIIVDLRYDEDNEKNYVNYYAAKNIEAAENETSTVKMYADMNAVNGKNEWFVLYYTKDTDAGLPLTTDLIVGSSAEAKEGYLAFHEFGSTAAVDLNKYNSGMNCKNVYAYIKQGSLPDSNVTGSVFSTETTAVLTSVAFIIGAVISGLVFGRKEKKQIA